VKDTYSSTLLAFTKYSYEGPSSRYRFYNYQQCFKEIDIDLIIKPLFGKAYFSTKNKFAKIAIVFLAYLQRLYWILSLLVYKKKYDLVLIEYELFPFCPAWFEYILTKRGIKYIVDYDDAIFHKYDMHQNGMIRLLLRNKIGQVMEIAQTVIVCNAYLEKYASQFNAKILKLPTVVLLDRYIEASQLYEEQKTKPYTIGWIGSKSTSVYIVEILPAIKKFVERHPDTRIDLVGFDINLLSKEQIREHHLNIIPWKEEDEISNILGFDVGIMPLHDDPWSRGKCGFKLVQYMSCGKPVVASPVGINVELVTEGSGFLAVSEDEWFKAFEYLYHNRDFRESMGKTNLLKIQKEYNHAANCQLYVQLVSKIVLKGKA